MRPWSSDSTIGASNHTAARLREALAVSAAQGLPRYECLQPLWNPMDDPSLPAPSGPPQVARPLSHPAKPAKPKPAHKHWL